MIGAVKQVAGALRSRTVAFSILVVQIVFGMLVVSHVSVLIDLFLQQHTLTGADMEGTYCLTSEDDDSSLPARDLLVLQGLPGVRHAAWVARAPIHNRRLPDLLEGTGHDIWEVNADSVYHETHVADEHPYREAPVTPEMQALEATHPD